MDLQQPVRKSLLVVILVQFLLVQFTISETKGEYFIIINARKKETISIILFSSAVSLKELN